ncbi:unnamed protein product [Clonostachys rhizophaga]|uniref:Uncharacterized protein n=1 Tax=Clonostachys rhizophaga TaxID=160324 RepID=A0A9N9V539_9HYPO|nr:unnamed protein product [Clonostachys rhizophaga]
MSRHRSDSDATIRAGSSQSTPIPPEKCRKILEELSKLSAQIDRASKNMSESFDQVLDVFKGGAAARDNRLAISRSARIQNDDTKRLNRERVLKDPSLPLLPLVDIRTGKEITSFPHDLKALNELDGKTRNA